MRKLLFALTVIGCLALFSLAMSCVNQPEPPQQEMTYRGTVPDSVFLRKQDIQEIADLVKYDQALDEYKREMNNMILKVAGTLISLLLMGLVYFLKKLMDAVPKLQSEVNKLSIALAASEQFNKDRDKRCDDLHEQIERRLNKMEQ